MNHGAIKAKKWSEGEVKYSILSNRNWFFLHHAMIFREEEHYRLFVCHNGKVLTDKMFSSLRGARIAFSKLYGEKCFNKDAKARWSVFFDGDPGTFDPYLPTLEH